MRKGRKNGLKSYVERRCDRCGSGVSKVDESLVITKINFVRRTDTKKDLPFIKIAGEVCKSCAACVLQGLTASLAHPLRVTLGLSNHRLLPYLYDIARKAVETGPFMHLEIERLDETSLLVSITSAEGHTRTFTYNTGFKTMVQVPDRAGHCKVLQS